MTRAHYIVRVGNDGLATKVSDSAPNHWHFLSPQRLWGFPRDLKLVNIRAKFESDIENPRVTTYVWFLCNGYGGPGHFVQVGIGRRHQGQGPVRNGNLPIPNDMMARLQQDFDHWFEWRPVTPNRAFHNQVRQLAIPQPTYRSTLRRVTADHVSFPSFESLLDTIEQQIAVVTTAQQILSTTRPSFEIDLENVRREQAEPHSRGHIYLIRMEGTTFYKIGMSFDPLIRLRTLQTGNPHPLTLLITQAVVDMRSAELSLHRLFAAQRVPNRDIREWFDFGTSIGDVEIAFGTFRMRDVE